jgi:hypothetical protein
MQDVSIEHLQQSHRFLIVPRLDLEIPEHPHVPCCIPELFDQLYYPPSAGP